MERTLRTVVGLAAGIAGFMLSGCQPAPPPATETVPIPATQVLPTLEPLPRWWLVATPTSQSPLEVSVTPDIPYTSEELLDVYSPVAVGDWPVAIVFHGGGDGKWAVGDLARAIAEQGAVVFAPTWRGSAPSPSSRIGDGAEDAACAIRFARARAAKYGGDARRVVVAGHSAGGMIGALMMLAGDEFHGDCLVQQGSALPDAFVGIDGGYDPIPFFSDEVLKANPAECLKIDPFAYLDHPPVRDELVFELFVGSYATSQQESQALRDALEAAGYSVSLTQIPGVDHNDMERPQPETVNAIAELLHWYW
jgi:acetyl esterase/lipase